MPKVAFVLPGYLRT